MKSLLGNLARRLVRALARIYYPRIEIADRDRLPAGGPVLFVANHPNSLMDPVLIGITAKRPVHFLAKAPLFKTPVLGPILHALGMIPAFRAMDDPTQLKRNLGSLEAGADFLARGEAVGIFPEGKSHDLPKVELVRSGAARIALAAAKKGARNAKIVPLGLNYERKERFRSGVWVRVGRPIAVEEFIGPNEEEERRQMRALTAEIDLRLKEVVVHLNEDAPYLEDLEVLLPPPPDLKRARLARIRQRKRIADAVNYFLATDRPRAEAAAAQIQAHGRNLAAEGLAIDSLLVRWRGAGWLLRFAGETFWMILWFVPALLGTVHHLVPFVLVRGLAQRIQSGRSTISLARLGLGLPIYGAWYVLVGWVLAQYFVPGVAWVWLAAMPFAGVFALNYWRRAVRDCLEWTAEFRMLFRRAKLDELRRERAALQDRLAALAAEYRKRFPPEPAPASSGSWIRRLGRAAFWSALLAAAVLAVPWGLSKARDSRLAELDHGGPDLRRMNSALLDAQLRDDTDVLAGVLSGLSELEGRTAVLMEEFAAGRRSFYRQQDDDLTRQLLFSYAGFRAELLRLLWTYQNFADLPEARARLQSFLLALASGAALFEYSDKFIAAFEGKPDAIRKLNEAEPLWNIPPGLYDTIRQQLLNPANRDRLRQALDLYHPMLPHLRAANLVEGRPFDRFHAVIQQAGQRLDQLSVLPADELLLGLGESRKLGKDVLYRSQALASVWIGNTRIRQPRSGKPLIRRSQLAEFERRLKPGDILLERQNWYLSRAFMPGYWPHAALYVGDLEDLIRLGIDRHPRVQAHRAALERLSGGKRAGLVLEAVPQGGVRISTLDACVGVADSAAALRPRLAPERIREAVLRAFSHVGKPYDFDFDFFSTDKLVCTELVYRAYDGDLEIPLVAVMGRKTLPPTELVRLYIREKASAAPRLELVAFLDGDETAGRARFRDEAIFRSTLARPSLTWLQGLEKLATSSSH